MCNWRRWVWPGIITTILLTALAVWFRSDHIESDLASKATAMLAENGQGWASVELDGRDLTLKGTAPGETARDLAIQLSDSAYDVRIVTDATDLLAAADPYLLKAVKDGGGIALSGNVPDAQTRSALVAASEAAMPGIGVTDAMTDARGMPDGFADLAAFGFGQLAGMTDGEVSLSNLDYSVRGTAIDSATYEKLTAEVNAPLPAGGKLVSAEILPPPAQGDYVWEAALDGNMLSFDGLVPDAGLRSGLAEEAGRLFPGASITANEAIASGAPEAFGDYSKFALDLLPRFQTGKVGLTGSELSVEGVAKSSEDYTAALETLKSLPAGLMLRMADIRPPSAPGDYGFAAVKQDGTIAVSGLAPDVEARDAILSTIRDANPGLDLTGTLDIAAGVPDGMDWTAATGAVAGRLSDLANGSVTLERDALTIAGVANDGAAFETLNAAIASGLPGGIASVSNLVTLPAASPYVWSAERNGGEVTVDGSAPSREAADANIAAAAARLPGLTLADSQELHSGAPEGYSAAVVHAFDALERLDPGKAVLTDNTLAISGMAPDLETAISLHSMLTGNAPAGISVTADINAPDVSPYAWNVRRTDRGVTLSGLVPDRATGDAMAAASRDAFGVGGVIDHQKLANGAPSHFGPATGYAVKSLKRLPTGAATLIDNRLRISGVAPDLATKLALEAELPSAAPEGVSVETAISAPVVRPYRWSLRKTKAGMTVAGLTPSEADRSATLDAIRSRGAAQVTDDQALALGAPACYRAAVGHAEAALAELITGAASLTDCDLTITGRVADEATRARLEAAIPANAPAGVTATARIIAPVAAPQPEPAKAPEPQPEPVAPPKPEIVITLPDPCDELVKRASGTKYINFDSGKADIRRGAFSAVEELLFVAHTCQRVRFHVEGHTDSVGSEAYNMGLASRRAEAIRDYLEDNGIADGRIETSGFGETRPIADNRTPEGRALNRRIEIRVIE